MRQEIDSEIIILQGIIYSNIVIFQLQLLLLSIYYNNHKRNTVVYFTYGTIDKSQFEASRSCTILIVDIYNSQSTRNMTLNKPKMVFMIYVSKICWHGISSVTCSRYCHCVVEKKTLYTCIMSSLHFTAVVVFTQEIMALSAAEVDKTLPLFYRNGYWRF